MRLLFKSKAARRGTTTYPWTVYNAGGHGLDAYRAEAASPTGITNVCMVFDSVGEGFIASETDTSKYLTDGAVGLFTTALTSKYGDTGMGLVPSFQGAQAAGSSKWTFSANWADMGAGFGIGGVNRYSEVSGSTAQFAFKGTGAVLTCICGYVGGNANVAIDGVSKGTINTYAENIGVQDFTVAAAGTLTDGEHILTVTTTSTASILLVGACALTNATTGFRVIRSCLYGAVAANFAGADSLVASVSHWAPKLTVIALIANDAQALTNVTTYGNQIQTLITAGKATGSVLLYADYPRPDMVSTASDAYLAKLLELSNSNDVPLIDMITPYKGQLASLGMVASDGTHPNGAGHNLIYQGLRSVLL